MVEGLFDTVQLSDRYTAECVGCADFNGDGFPDVVAGPCWYEGPDFCRRHVIFEPTAYDPHGYARATQPCFVHDFNGDGRPDVFYVVRRPGPKGNFGFYGWGEANGWDGVWYENPGRPDTPWTAHHVLDNIANEAVVFGDVDGDGRPELVYNSRDAYGYARFDPARPDAPWTFRAISEPATYTLGQGVGLGDITGNGLLDIVCAHGWWEHPAADSAHGPWPWHPAEFADNAANMVVTDVDGDGLADVVTVWHAHRYGLLWYRQSRSRAGGVDWERHEILPVEPDISCGALRVSQLHAVAVGDLDGNGLPDIVAGKRHWAHGPSGDPEADGPALLCWFRPRRRAGALTFQPHLIHGDCGAGTQVVLADLDGDGRPDVLTSNKKGTYVHFNRLGRVRRSNGP
jgi:hypothetical protein